MTCFVSSASKLLTPSQCGFNECFVPMKRAIFHLLRKRPLPYATLLGAICSTHPLAATVCNAFFMAAVAATMALLIFLNAVINNEMYHAEEHFHTRTRTPGGP